MKRETCQLRKEPFFKFMFARLAVIFDAGHMLDHV
jgi:hypothetical protein